MKTTTPNRSGAKLGLIASLSIAAMAAFGAGPAAGQVIPGYQFSDVSVRLVEQRPGSSTDQELAIKLEFATSWATDEFPGWRLCTFTVFTSDATPMAHKTLQLADGSPQPSNKSTVLDVSLPTIGQVPRDVDIKCLPERLDDPTGFYQFNNIEVSADDSIGTAAEQYRLVFDAEWSASGMAGLQKCTANIKDSTGRSLFSYPFGFLTAEGTSQNIMMPVVSPSPLAQEPTQADITCLSL